ncbi:MAG: type II CAAX prenyl endopeptidase Rce1 family protein [Dysgonomonas sp.]
MMIDTKVKINFWNRYFILISPIIVLTTTKIIVEICRHCFQTQISWLPSFIGYYTSILFVLFIAQKKGLVFLKDIFDVSLKPLPKIKWVLIGVILPALIPLNVFILKINSVPFEYIIYIFIFSIINPIFEEGFWRGLLSHLPYKKIFIVLYSALLFGFSHYWFWHHWFNIPIVTITTVISTTIMGVLWMSFFLKNKKIIYLIISHFLVDIFNLSVAIYSGVIPAW